MWSRVCLLMILCLTISAQNSRKPVDWQYFSSPLNLYLSDTNASQVFKPNPHVAKPDIIGVLFTNLNCLPCHQQQPQLRHIIQTAHQSYGVKIYRSELIQNMGLQEQFHTKRYPMLHFIIRQPQDYHIYQIYSPTTLQSAIHTIIKLKHKLELAFNISHQDKKQEPSGIVINSNRFSQQVHHSLLVDIAFDPVLQNLPQLSFDSEWFQGDSKSSCAFWIAEEEECVEVDSWQEVEGLLRVINFHQTIEFNEATYPVWKKLQLYQHVFVAAVDSINDRNGTEKHLSMLNQVAKLPFLRNKVTIFWMETQLNPKKLPYLGFKPGDRQPLFALMDLSSSTKKVMDAKTPFTRTNILSFIDSVVQDDEQSQLAEWQHELLHEAQKRLGIAKEVQLVAAEEGLLELDKDEIVLTLPNLSWNSVSQGAKVLYGVLLNYRYLTQRITRFGSSLEVVKVGFGKVICGQKKSHGLFVKRSGKCLKIAKAGLQFDYRKLAKKEIDSLIQFMNLPPLFHVNQHNYPEQLAFIPPSLDQIKFKATQVDL